MQEISFQAVQFLPRLLSVMTLLLLTWLVAKFTKYVVLRAVSQAKRKSLVKTFFMKVSHIAFWMVVLLFSPFLIGAAGLNAVWLRQVQLHLGQIFSNWPIWMLMSVIVAGISYLLLNIPRLLIQLKGSPGNSPKKF